MLHMQLRFKEINLSLDNKLKDLSKVDEKKKKSLL